MCKKSFLNPFFTLLMLTCGIGMVKGNELIDTLTDPGSYNYNSLTFQMPQKSVPRKLFYYSFIFNYGKNPFSISPSNLHLSFPYQRVPGNFTYDDSVHLNKRTRNIPAFMFGLELGKVNGLFGSVAVVVPEAKLPNGSFGDYVSFDIALGRDIQLDRGFALKPSVAMSFNFFPFDFERGIDNHNSDVMAFNQLFLYRYTTSGRTKISRTNESISVSIEDIAYILKPNLAIVYKLNKKSRNCLVLQANIGYSMLLGNQERMLMHGAPTANVIQKLNSPNITFTSDVSPHQLFNYQGVSWGIGIAYAINYGGLINTHKNQSGVTRYSDHPK